MELTSVLTMFGQPLDIPTGNLVEDIDITINPTESLLANEIVTISTEETTDMLMGFFLQSFCYNSKR